MKQRLLVSFHEIRVPQIVTAENGRLVGFTKPFPDRADQCCLEVTREQWAELQRSRWASPIIENGFLVPDVDFVAKDGAVFQDAETCLAHDRALTVSPWRRVLEDSRSGQPGDLCGNHERVGWLEIDLIKIGSEETLLAILNGYEHLICHELRDFETRLVLFGTHPAFDFVQVPESEAVDFYALPKYEVLDGQIARENRYSSDPHKVAPVGSTPTPDTTDLCDWRAEFIAAQICSDVVQYSNGEFCNASTETRFQQWQEEKTALASFARVLHNMQAGDVVTCETPNPLHIDAMLDLASYDGKKATLEGDDVVVCDPRPKQNPALEAKLLTALANGPLKAKPLAELTGSTVDEIKACVKASAFLVWTGAYLAIKPQTVQ